MTEYPKWSPRRDLSPDHSEPAAAVQAGSALFFFEFQVLTDVILRHVIIQANSARRKLSRKLFLSDTMLDIPAEVWYLGLGGTGE